MPTAEVRVRRPDPMNDPLTLPPLRSKAKGRPFALGKQPMEKSKLPLFLPPRSHSAHTIATERRTEKPRRLSPLPQPQDFFTLYGTRVLLHQNPRTILASLPALVGMSDFLFFAHGACICLPACPPTRLPACPPTRLPAYPPTRLPAYELVVSEEGPRVEGHEGTSRNGYPRKESRLSQERAG
jgi:hypothetical protein